MLSPAQRAALAQLESLWPGRGVLIGASALHVQRPNEPWRMTKDIDVVVACDLDQVGRARELGWSQDPRRAHRWFLPGGGWVDVIPASESIRASGQLVWPDGQVMSTVGLDLAFEHAYELALGGVAFRVAPLPVLLVLKVVSYTGSADRQHDLVDIARLVDAHVLDDDDRRWDDDIPADISFEATSAYLLGRDVASVAPAELMQRLIAFCEAATTVPLSLSLYQAAPVAWRASPAAAPDRVDALRRGLTA